jgi:hypothetical protein
MYPDPFALEGAVRERISNGASARLLSSYSRPWVTRDIAEPSQLPPSMKDFHETVVVDGQHRTWSRVWNVVPAHTDDYSYFVQGSPGSAIAVDALCEVGCPYAIRGFDYDYIGVLWLEDFVWRRDQWRLNLEHVHESGVSRLVTLARGEPQGGPATEKLLQQVAKAYRILLTRALKGVFVWVKDDETRRHLESSLA